jgi:hypothetical protein
VEKVSLEEAQREAEVIMAVAIILKKSSPTISARHQFGLTRREIAGLLDTPPKSDRISVGSIMASNE